MQTQPFVVSARNANVADMVKSLRFSREYNDVPKVFLHVLQRAFIMLTGKLTYEKLSHSRNYLY